MNSSPNRWLYVLAAALILVVVLLSMPIATDFVPEVPYSELRELVERGQVEEIAFRGSEATAKLTAPLPLGPGGSRHSRSIPMSPHSATISSCPCSRRRA